MQRPTIYSAICVVLIQGNPRSREPPGRKLWHLLTFIDARYFYPWGNQLSMRKKNEGMKVLLLRRKRGRLGVPSTDLMMYHSYRSSAMKIRNTSCHVFRIHTFANYDSTASSLMDIYNAEHISANIGDKSSYTPRHA